MEVNFKKAYYIIMMLSNEFSHNSHKCKDCVGLHCTTSLINQDTFFFIAMGRRKDNCILLYSTFASMLRILKKLYKALNIIIKIMQ